MSLIEVSALGRKFRPVHWPTLRNLIQQSAEPPNAAKQLRCEPNVLAEQVDEPGVAQTSIQLYFSNATYSAFTRQLLDRISDCRMNRSSVPKFSDQILLHHQELRMLARSGAHVVE